MAQNVLQTVNNCFINEKTIMYFYFIGLFEKNNNHEMASAPSSDSLFLESDETVQTFVRPLVMLSILDHHQRRKEGQNRVIGALMGRIEDNVVLVTDCFPVTHKDDAGMVLINRADIAAMVKSVRMVNKLESIVGWCVCACGRMPH